MQFGRKLIRFVPVALVMLIVFLTTARAYGAAGAGEGAGHPPAAAQTAQPAPAASVDTGVLAGATWVLLLPLVLLAKLKISEARRIAWLESRPGLEIHQIADLLEDYRLDPDAPFPR